MRLRFSAQAVRDLEQIHVYGTLQFGLVQADHYSDRLRETFDRIAEFPELARERREFRPFVRLQRCESHNVIYRIEAEDVWVLRVLHRSVDWPDQI